MKSQPTWACASPRSAPRQLPPWSTCGLCGSPGWSEKAWCLRWSATHEMTGPSIAIDPSAASVARTALPVLNDRWVKSRWNPTVIPSPVEMYMIANTIRSLQPRSSDQTCQATRPSARIGRTVTVPVRKRSSVSLATGWTSSRCWGTVVAIRAGSLARHRKIATGAALQLLMNASIRRISMACASAAAVLTLTTSPAHAIVGGHDAAAGAYPSIAEVHLAKSFLCAGTLIVPDWVLAACLLGSVTVAAVATPVSFPGPLIDVYIGSTRAGAGELVPVSEAIVSPSYLLTQGYDVTLLHLSRPSASTPTKIAGAGE